MKPKPDADGAIRPAVAYPAVLDPNARISIEHAAHLLATTEESLREQLRRGLVPLTPHRIGRRVLLRYGDVIALNQAPGRPPLSESEVQRLAEAVAPILEARAAIASAKTGSRKGAPR